MLTALEVSMRRVVVVAFTITLLAACTSDEPSATSAAAPATTTSSPASTTTAPTTTATTSTTVEPQPDAGGMPPYLVAGWEGVTRVANGVASRLVGEPVRWAADDGAGGIVFASVAAEPGIAWLASGAARPQRADMSGRLRSGVELVTAVDGRPSLIANRAWTDMVWCGREDFIEEVYILDLATGDERLVRCRHADPDADEAFSSYGGGLFTVVPHVYVAASETSTSLLFFDPSGERVTVDHNPFSESCAPCHLSARLSPDGSRLAYAYWPAAYWGEPEPEDGDYDRARDEWWEAHRELPTQLAVVALETGEELWRGEATARADVDVFDGRYVTIATDVDRTIHDTVTGEALTIPPATTAPAAFWTAIVGSYPVDEHSYEEAQRHAAQVTDRHAVAASVVWSSGYPTLRPGYWAVFTGQFSTRAEAAARCAELTDPAEGCYPKYIATAETIDPTIGRDMLALSGDGLGIVRFGDDADDVITMLTRLLGPPATNDMPYPGESIFPGSHFQIVGWEEPNLRVWIMDWNGDRVVQPPILGFWSTVDETGALATDAGIGVGDLFSELLATYGDRIAVFAPDECTSTWQFAIDHEEAAGPFFIRGGLDGDPAAPGTRIAGMRAGIEMGPC